MSDDELLYDVENGIGTITLNRPQARNALTFELASVSSQRPGGNIPVTDEIAQPGSPHIADCGLLRTWLGSGSWLRGLCCR